MMPLGFVTAILPELSLREVVAFAAETGYSCVEAMCWPSGKAERRYAGVTHIDVTDLTPARADDVNVTLANADVSLSGLGYYPNLLSFDRDEADRSRTHLEQVIRAAPLLGVSQVNTFVGRDPRLSIDENWPRFREVWPGLVRIAEQVGVRIGIENCPMLFTRDEWPGGKNLAISPAVWRRMFAADRKSVV